jgi:chromosomal replication initiation ATPase DnaA
MLTNFDYPAANLCLIDFNVQADAIIREMSRISGYDIRIMTRKQEVVKARQIAMWRIRNATSLSLKGIGDMFPLDYSTVIHALKVVQDIIETKDKKYYPLVEPYI